MRLRNNIFAAAFDYLKREKGIKTQKRLAELMGVSEDTITRILKDRCEVTEDIITKLQTASGCIFNLQWLRGEDPQCMLMEDLIYYKQHPEERMVFDKSHVSTTPTTPKEPAPQAIDYTFLIEKAVEKATAYADKYIAVLEKQVEDKDKEIDRLLHRIQELEAIAKFYKDKNPLEDYPFDMGVADRGDKKTARV